ncbi:MAG: hypothetical protein E7370_03120 [Clostridiales bacterium]|nr:hypothetical protein [Clostridiales bacterium]
MQKLKSALKKLPLICYTLVFALASYLFFTNDFGLVDIHKTSIVMAVGIDIEEDNSFLVTAQIAVPQPSENGENTSYTEVSGKGVTVAEALNEINSKTGFYPKLLHCRLILLGESCKSKNVFETLDYFYRNEYAQLTALVTMCKGKAQELLSMPTPMATMTTLSLQRILSDELKKSANVSTVNLKELAQDSQSPSKACYIPYIETEMQGSVKGVEQDGKKIADESGGQGGQGAQNSGGNAGGVGGSGGSQEGKSGGSGSSGGSQEGKSSGSGSSGGSQEGKSSTEGGGGEKSSQGAGGGGSSQGSQGSSQKSGGTTEFTCRKTAVFNDGNFVGILSEEQAFALNLIKNKVRLAIVSVDADGKSYAVGLRNTQSGTGLKFENNIPVFSYSFKAKARVQDVTEKATAKKLAQSDNMPQTVLDATQGAVKSALTALTDFCKQNNCDLVGAKQNLYKYNNSRFKEYESDLIQKMLVGYEIAIKSAR